MASGTTRGIVALLVALGVLAAAVFAVLALIRIPDITLIPPEERCVATVNGQSTALNLEQAHYSSIIVGLSVRRGLPPRAGSIAMATVYQETDIRNLDYGDRDSVGLFQQRPSQGWGTEQQLMDPYYATGKFYDALVRVPGWRTGDITEVAQAVQRSGYPDAYRDHEADARVLASALTGQTPAAISCLDRSGSPGRPTALVKDLRKTFGKTSATSAERVVTVQARSKARAWAYGHYAVANAQAFGVASVQVLDRSWVSNRDSLAEWLPADPLPNSVEVQITLR